MISSPARWLPIAEARQELADAQAWSERKEAEGRLHGSDPQWRLRFDGKSVDLEHQVLLAFYLEARGALDASAADRVVSEALAALASRARLFGRGHDPDFWIPASATRAEPFALRDLQWAPANPPSNPAGDWWIGVGRDDREARDLALTSLRSERRNPNDARWHQPPGLRAAAMEALDARDGAALEASVEALLTDHEERAHEDFSVLHRVSRTPYPSLVSLEAMGLLAEGRRRDLAVGADSPFVTPRFRAVARRARKPRSSPAAAAPRLDLQHASRWLRDMTTRLDTSPWGRAQDWHAFDFAAELALRRAMLKCATCVHETEHEHLVDARRALHDFVRFADAGNDPERPTGGRLLPFVQACRAECAAILGLAPPLIRRDVPSPTDALYVRLLAALHRRDDEEASTLAAKLACRRVPDEDAPPARRFDPRLPAEAANALVTGDASRLQSNLEALLDWHRLGATPRPRGSKRAQTADLHLACLPVLALMALARARGLEHGVDDPFAPAKLPGSLL